MEMYPLKFEPVYKDYIWGGDKIVKKYNRPEPEGTYAESWEVSDREEGMSIVANGPLRGKSLKDLVKSAPDDLLGSTFAGARFPLLIKLIDSRQKLSVQVHPNDDNADRTGGEAKTEMWYLLEAEPQAEIVAGLKEGVDEKRLRDALREGGVSDLLEKVPVQTGDAIYMPGGRVHAICEGCLILEVQQNSNTTYRLYDWGRVGNDGQPRELHIDEAMQVIRWQDSEELKPDPRLLEKTGSNEIWSVLDSPYFMMGRLILSENQTFDMPQGFEVLFCARGECRIDSANGGCDMSAGDTVLLPAALTDYTVQPVATGTEILRIAASR